MGFKWKPSCCVNIHWNNSKGTWKKRNINERKNIQQPNEKRKDKHERTIWTRRYYNHESR